MDIKAKESAVVVIDMQKDFCYEDGALFVGEAVKDIIPRIKELLKRAMEKNVELIFTQDWHSSDDEEFKIWGRHCVMDTRGAEIIDEYSTEEKKGYKVKKKRYSAFFETDFDSYLREKGIKTLIMVGVVTNICVLHTAGDAVLRGYKVVIPRDCVAALNDYDHEYGLHHIEFVFKGVITTLDEIVFS
ncbi:MAG: cysteine hydrolase family protein [Candidatus Methanospirareceae archaeon]